MFWKEQTSLVVHLDLSLKTIIWLVQEVQGKLCRVCRIYFVMLLLCEHPLPETVFSPMLKNALRPSGVHLKLFGFILGCATKCLSVKPFLGNLSLLEFTRDLFCPFPEMNPKNSYYCYNSWPFFGAQNNIFINPQKGNEFLVLWKFKVTILLRRSERITTGPGGKQ